MQIEQSFHNIFLVEKKGNNAPKQIHQVFPGKKICICDFYVQNSENGVLDNNGSIHYNDLLIIDHHGNINYMKRHISSAVIACQYVEQKGVLSESYAIVINHTDADSIISSVIMSGILPANDFLGKAAIAADHTGKQNIIADVLQSLEDERDLAKSVAILQSLVIKRINARNKIQKWIENGKFQWHGDIAYIILDEKIDVGLVPSYLPQAKVIVVASPMTPGSKKWRIGVRLGIHADDLAVHEWQLPDFGGRWNAGSTSRHGGTSISPRKYVEIISQNLR